MCNPGPTILYSSISHVIEGHKVGKLTPFNLFDPSHMGKKLSFFISFHASIIAQRNFFAQTYN